MNPLSVVIEQLNRTATLLEMKGENPFRSRAYAKAAEILETHADEFEERVQKKNLTELVGIGKELERTILDLAATGTFPLLAELEKLFPASLFEVLQVPGLGPKKVAFLYLNLGISTLGELEYACQENRLVNLKGFGEKMQTKICQALQFLKQVSGKRLLNEALEAAARFEAHVQKEFGLSNMIQVGELRRKCPVVSELAWVASSPLKENFPAAFEGMSVTVQSSSPETHAWNVWQHTGHPSHVALVTQCLEQMGLLTRAQHAAEEKDIYALINLPYVPPECREEGELGIYQRNFSGELLPRIKGVFHVHSNYSDGTMNLERLVQKSVALGYEYLAISDHSQSAFYAQGLRADMLEKQKKELDGVKARYPQIKVFWGIESDILKDGSLDYPDEVLRGFDFVIASVHSRFGLNREEMTKRCVAALKNPYTTILGHPTGRLLLARDEFPVDMNQILETAIVHGKIIELNANPQRLDLDWQVLRTPQASNLMTSINPDIHHESGFDHTEIGCWMAQKAMVDPSRILNTKTAGEVEAFLGAKRKS